PLELHEDGRGLGMADPDRQELVPVAGLQQHDRLLADHVEAHAVDAHILHLPGALLAARGLSGQSSHGRKRHWGPSDKTRAPKFGAPEHSPVSRHYGSASAGVAQALSRVRLIDPGFEPGTSTFSVS